MYHVTDMHLAHSPNNCAVFYLLNTCELCAQKRIISARSQAR